MNEFEWRRRIGQLRQPVEPSRDLWPGIAAAIADEPRRKRRPWRATALAAGLLGAVMLGSALLHRHAPGGDAVDATTAASRAALLATLSEQRDMPRAYDAALLAVLGPGGGDALIEDAPPEIAAAALELIAAEVEIERALTQAPGSPQLLEHLRRTAEMRLKLARLRDRAG